MMIQSNDYASYSCHFQIPHPHQKTFDIKKATFDVLPERRPVYIHNLVQHNNIFLEDKNNNRIKDNSVKNYQDVQSKDSIFRKSPKDMTNKAEIQPYSPTSFSSIIRIERDSTPITQAVHSSRVLSKYYHCQGAACVPV